MDDTRQFNIALPADVADLIEERVRSGAYASVSDVVREGVRELAGRDASIERWLREEVMSGHEEYLADPSRAVPAEELLARIKVGKVPSARS